MSISDFIIPIKLGRGYFLDCRSYSDEAKNLIKKVLEEFQVFIENSPTLKKTTT